MSATRVNDVTKVGEVNGIIPTAGSNDSSSVPESTPSTISSVSSSPSKTAPLHDIAIPHVTSLSVHTGNIVNSNRLKRSATQSATYEVSECVSFTIQGWLEGLSSEEKQNLQSLTKIRCIKFLEKLPVDERPDYKITVKIFVGSLRKDAIEDAISNVLDDLGTDSVETVILSVPEASRNYSDLKELWQALEKEVEAHRVYSLGISDLNKLQLEELYSSVKEKPCINQVNLTTCCVIPQDLAEFAKEHDVQLLTHNDPPVILSAEECQELMRSSLTSTDAHLWQPCWVVRYSVLIKARGVIKTKGYIMRAARDL